VLVYFLEAHLFLEKMEMHHLKNESKQIKDSGEFDFKLSASFNMILFHGTTNKPHTKSRLYKSLYREKLF